MAFPLKKPPSKLLEDLLTQKTYACSTVQINRKGLPPGSQRKLKKGETFVMQKGNLVFTKWHDKRDVSILSTNCDPLDPPNVIERRNTRGEVVRVEKPKAVVMYNEHMGGVDRANQLRSYYRTCRPSHKWYRYLFWFIFEVVLGHAFIIDKENVPRQSCRTVREFHLALAKQLIGSFSSRSENTKRSQKAALLQPCVSPENSAGHFVSRRERHCMQCKKDGRKTTSNRAHSAVLHCVKNLAFFASILCETYIS